MASSKTSSAAEAIPDGSFDWSGGVDSNAVTTVQSSLNPNGLKRNQLAWLNNGTVRGGGILQRLGMQPLLRLMAAGHWQGGYMYEPDGANPYLVCSISGHIYKVLLEAPYTITDLSVVFSLINPDATAERAFFCQGENYLVIQAGDYFTNPVPTLPLFWDGTTLRRSIGITNPALALPAPHVNEIPAATCMDYFGNRIWYAQARSYGAGDIVGGAAGTAPLHGRDAILNVTENPLCMGGDNFSLPTNSGNIRALKHTANINVTLGEGQLYIFTRKAVYSLSVPTTRTEWINAGNDGSAAGKNGMPLQTVVQLVNGSVNDISVVPINGDLFYQSLDPAIRSLITAVRYFQQPGNTAISQNELRALQVNDRGLMRFSSGIEWDQRLLQLVLPKRAADGVNVVHQAILPLDFDIVTTLEQRMNPVWEGAYDGLQHLQLFGGDFGGLQRAFSVVISDVDGSINVWELTSASRTENGDNRVLWSFESPAFTWNAQGLEFQLKQLSGGEMWVDKVSGTVDMDAYYRSDADPCWRRWFHTSFCAARDCEEQEPVVACYPDETFREGYKFPVVFPEPPVACNSMGVRPSTIGYQFQVKVVLKGWCRVRGLILYALPREKAQYSGITCAEPTILGGMKKLPNAFAP